MLQLFEFQKKEVRTTMINGTMWFSGQDIFTVLELIWKGKNSLTQRKIPSEWIKKKVSQTMGGDQEMTFIHESAMYMLTFSSQKTEVSLKFSKWVANLLSELRNSVINNNCELDDVNSNVIITIQKQNSKNINSKNYISGGIEKTKEYNTKNCLLHTNMTPSQVKEIGKNMGLKSIQRSSAKEVLRNIKPEKACSMSYTDRLVFKEGINHELAAETSVKFAEPLFKRLMELGISRERIEN